MKQIVQHQKTGEILFEETPAPQCLEGGILVKTAFSLISAGTEKTGVGAAKSSLIQRARKQPDQVRLVLDFIKKEGLVSTIKRVQNKLESYKTLGYSLSGVVVETRTEAFAVGDRVACAGAGYAVHSEMVTVPKNLAVKIPENVTFEDAAYTTLGAIALQGVRQADLRLGESACVIGLGLLGRITIQLLKASGCRVAGSDVNPDLFPSALECGADTVFLSSKDEIQSMKSASGGAGFDAVIITAGSSSNEPVELSMQIARKRGKVVVVGAVGMNIPRSPFYEKEIDFKISCSYGPGRYDPDYEEGGADYPLAFVRWTENRNMGAFLDLISAGKINVAQMTTHRVKAEDAAKAYDIIMGKTPEPFAGILLEYSGKPHEKRPVIIKEHAKLSDVNAAFVGAGAFAQSQLMNPLKSTGANLVIVTTSTPANAVSAAKLFGFAKAGTDSLAAIADPDVNMVFCATRHDSHAEYVIKAVKENKPIFVEKPLCATLEQALEIEKALSERPARIMVGFNRRFSKPFKHIEEFFRSRTDPMMIKYRVNAGFIPKTHWLYRPGNGDGRIVGEACHFIDCMTFLTKSLPVRVYSESVSSNNPESYDRDNVVITIRFADGSVGALEYAACGDGALPKEYCEVFCEKSVAVMNNFNYVETYRGGKVKKTSFDGKKGIEEEVAATIAAVKAGGEMPIPFEQIRAVTLATFAALESLDTGAPVDMRM